MNDPKFVFTHDQDGSLSLESAILQALGFASICWKPLPTGVFQTEAVQRCSDALIDFIREEQAP